MARPYKPRWITHLPDVTVFRPVGLPLRYTKRTIIGLDEFEAIRLVDGEGLDQTEAARRMKVSRPTVGRILERGRKKIALSLAYGETLVLEAGAAPILRQAVRKKDPFKIPLSRKSRHGLKRFPAEIKDNQSTRA